MKSLFLAALLALAPGIASAQTTSTGDARQVMTETASNGCLCPGGKEIKRECCPPPDKKKNEKPAEEKK